MTIKNIKPVNKILSKTSDAKCPPKPTRKKPEATKTMVLRPTAKICTQAPQYAHVRSVTTIKIAVAPDASPETKEQLDAH